MFKNFRNIFLLLPFFWILWLLQLLPPRPPPPYLSSVVAFLTLLPLLQAVPLCVLPLCPSSEACSTTSIRKEGREEEKRKDKLREPSSDSDFRSPDNSLLPYSKISLLTLARALACQQGDGTHSISRVFWFLERVGRPGFRCLRAATDGTHHYSYPKAA